MEIYQWWKLGLFLIIIEWESIQYFTFALEIPLSRKAKPSTYVNHVFEDTRTQNSLITSGENNRLGHTDLFV